MKTAFSAHHEFDTDSICFHAIESNTYCNGGDSHGVDMNSAIFVHEYISGGVGIVDTLNGRGGGLEVFADSGQFSSDPASMTMFLTFAVKGQKYLIYSSHAHRMLSTIDFPLIVW